MRYARQALIDACDAALVADEKAWQRTRAEKVEENSARLQHWNKQYGELWATAGLAIRRAIREGRPVTRETIPWNDRFGQPAVFSPDNSIDKEYEPPRELTFLRRILDVVTDDMVTTSGLEKLGVSVRTMRAAAWHLGHATAREGN